MPRQKKSRLLDVRSASAGDLSTDLLANILGYLDGPKDVMQKRRVCKKWKEAVKETTVPLSKFVVSNLDSYNAMTVMTGALPNLQQITICTLRDYDVKFGLGYYHIELKRKYSDGEDPDEERAAETANWRTLDIEIISNFTKLKDLEINSKSLNGRYPVLFNFPHLEKLRIHCCDYLEFDLEMLAGLPLLKELHCYEIFENLTGNISSLRVLKDTLEKVIINCCPYVEGNVMDLANFPHLKELSLFQTDVTGDFLDIGVNDFSSLEKRLIIPTGCRLHRISDAPDLVRALYLLKKQRPTLIDILGWSDSLSENSPDWYESRDEYDSPPFLIRFVQAGPRIGYRWQRRYHGCNPCEVNWLDPEPDTASSDYAQYRKELQVIESEVNMYRGFYKPPTEEEYNRLYEE